MKRICTLLLCLTFCLGPVQSLGQGTDTGYLQGYLTDLSQGENLDALYACLDATMQAALSREDFASLWGQLAAISGEFLGFDGDTESTTMGEYLVLTQRLDMAWNGFAVYHEPGRLRESGWAAVHPGACHGG